MVVRLLISWCHWTRCECCLPDMRHGLAGAGPGLQSVAFQICPILCAEYLGTMTRSGVWLALMDRSRSLALVGTYILSSRCDSPAC